MKATRLVVSDALLTAFSAVFVIWLIVSARPPKPASIPGRPPDDSLFIAMVSNDGVPIDLSSTLGCALVSDNGKVLGWWSSVANKRAFPGVGWPKSSVPFPDGEGLVLELSPDVFAVEQADLYFFLSTFPRSILALAPEERRIVIDLQVQDGLSDVVKVVLESENQFLCGVSVAQARQGVARSAPEIDWASLVSVDSIQDVDPIINEDFDPSKFATPVLRSRAPSSGTHSTDYFNSQYHRTVHSRGRNPKLSTGLRIFPPDQQAATNASVDRFLSILLSNMDSTQDFRSPIFFGDRGMSAVVSKGESLQVVFIARTPEQYAEVLELPEFPHAFLPPCNLSDDQLLTLVARRFSQSAESLKTPVFLQHPEVWLRSQ